MRQVVVILLSATFSLGSLLQAQNADLPHVHSQSKVIDGALTPEKIPDLTAYRLFLLVVSRSANPTDQEKKHQLAQLGMIRLNDADVKTAIPVLVTFREQYQSLINAYNETAKAAWARGESADIGSFVLQRDQIVQAARDMLSAKLSADGWSRFDAHVKAEKKRMRISAKEDGQ
jgi:hypothetical protein